jgi:uncharacterized iron-regulated membrane protein
MMKKIAGKLHLILGLVTGLVFMLVCLTGALLAFTEESLNIVNREHLYVAPRNAPKVPIEDVLATYRKTYPREMVFVMNEYRQPDRSYDFFSAVQNEKNPDDFGGYKMVYADPYTGKILHVDKGTLEFLVLAVGLHINLLMGDFGHDLIRWCTLLFFVQLVAGVILWWPRNRAALKGAVRWAWNSGKRRRLYDSHRTLGFYAAVGLLVMVSTALFMSWTWISKPVTAAFGGEPSLIHDHDEEHVHARRGEGPEFSYAELGRRVFAAQPGANQMTYLIPFPDTISTITLKTHSGSTFLNFSVGAPLQFDRVTGEQDMSAEALGEARNAKIFATNLLIHMGFWGGTPTKILYFVLGILGASLPVTGFFLWYGKYKRRRAGRIVPDDEEELEAIEEKELRTA